jgi:prefoldin subunit 5
MFGKLLNKPATEPSSETVPAAARRLVEEPESDVHALKRSRAAVEAEIEVLAGQHDKATQDMRELRKKTKPPGWNELNSYGGTPSQIYADTPLGRALGEATDRCTQLRTALDEKAAELERLTKLIHAIEREVPGRLRREALEAAMPLVFDLIDALCAAAGHEAEYVRLGGTVERSVPWEFALAGGEGVELETVMSRWLRALKREGIKFTGDVFDNSRHLPAPASVHAHTQTEAGYAAHHSRCGERAGFRTGFMTHARHY